MKNYALLSILFVSFLLSCNKKSDNSKVVIETTGFSDSTLIYFSNLEKETQDSGYIINNYLEFIADVDEPTHFCINPIIKSRADADYRYFWKENNKLTIKAEKGKLKQATVEGSKTQIQADIVSENKAVLKLKLDSIVSLYRSIADENVDERLATRMKGEEIEKAIGYVDVNYIRNNPDELYSAIVLKSIMSYDITKELAKELYEGLSPKQQNSKYGVIVNKFLELSTDLKVGDKAINFQLPDIDGNLIGLDSFEGKYILLNFWSSSCGVCQIENPILLRNYKAYRSKGLEIIGVSLDKNKTTWETTVKSDSMIWTTVSDLKGFDGDLAITYNIFMIPTYFLINPDGVIIEKNVGRDQLEEKLKAVFDNL